MGMCIAPVSGNSSLQGSRLLDHNEESVIRNPEGECGREWCRPASWAYCALVSAEEYMSILCTEGPCWKCQ